MRGSDFVRKISHFGRQNGVDVRFVAHRGIKKHGTLSYGKRVTILHCLMAEHKRGTLRLMLEQLGLKHEVLRDA